MEKLQDMIDAVFGNIDHHPTTHSLNEAAVERERAFAERARKIQKLKEARLQAKAG